MTQKKEFYSKINIFVILKRNSLEKSKKIPAKNQESIPLNFNRDSLLGLEYIWRVHILKHFISQERPLQHFLLQYIPYFQLRRERLRPDKLRRRMDGLQQHRKHRGLE